MTEIETLRRQLDELDAKYKRQLAEYQKPISAWVPPPIQAEILRAISNKMEKIDAQIAVLQQNQQ